ncbi:CotH kinase family protein [Candidatus Marimicrobium litorale]|nr:CotH kinase family protein [Candidatus Marimicrobium litorale]
MLAPLLLALALLAGIQYIQQHPSNLRDVLECPRENPLCIVVEDMARDASNVHYDLQRQMFDKKTLPVMKIYLTNGALDKLYQKRRQTLNKPGQILIKDDNDWVKASIILNSGNEIKELNTRLRLKGDWPDHYEHPTKLSFRIKVLGESYALGMKRFSIQHPNTRSFQAEPLMLDEMRNWGILAPKYRFIDVRINDYPIGIMALEEHVSKEMLESQRRREGPILVVDEDPIWRQKDLNAQTAAAAGANNPPLNSSNLRIIDLPIKQFGAPSFSIGSTKTTNAIRAISLYRDFIDGKRSAETVFDLEKMARWWVLVNAWYSCHGVAYHNRRFYFNPTTNLLEPIAFDNAPRPHGRGEYVENCDIFVANRLQGDVNFQTHVLDFSQLLLETYQSAAWQSNFKARQAKAQNILLLDGFDTRPLLPKEVVQNLSYFLKALTFTNAETIVSDSTSSSMASYSDAPLYSHLRTFFFPLDSGLSLEIKNLSYDPIEDIRITIDDNQDAPRVVQGPQLLPAYNTDGAQEQHIITMNIDEPFTDTTKITVDYTYRDVAMSMLAVPQHRNHVTGFKSMSGSSLFERSGVSQDSAKKSIRFTGSHEISESLEVDKGWSVVLAEGSSLALIDGATLKIRGPLYIQGTEEDPVTIEVTPSPEYNDAGAWGGILVSQSPRRSRIQHAVLRGAGSATLANRQDYYGITGCLTFYESDVDIVDSTFSDMHCEDALNIVRSNFTISHTTIERPRADGFDSDFSHGELRDSRFLDTGNDAVDISGTRLTLKNIYFRNIGDKSISVGEKSILHASRLNIDFAATGVASKDKSTAHIIDSHFANISGSGLITYIKKREYGSASIDCDNCTFTNTTYKATNQLGSKIRIDGVAQAVTNYQLAHLREAGFVTE